MATVHVVSVVASGGSSSLWTFDTAVTAAGSGAGFAVDGDLGNSATPAGPNALTIDAVNPHSAGDPWDVIAADVDATFAGGALLTNQSGTTT